MLVLVFAETAGLAWCGLEIGLEVDVECFVGSFSQGCFHAYVVGVGGPGVVYVTGYAVEIVSYSGLLVGGLED